MRPKQVSEAIKVCLEANVVPCVEGPPGCGKTAIVRQTAQETCHNFQSIVCSVLEPVDIMGMPSVSKGIASFAPFGMFAELFAEDVPPTLALLDDLGQSTPAVQAAIMQLLHGGRLNGHTVRKNVRFVIATNRAIDRAAVNRLISPIRGRVISIPFEINSEDWKQWALTAKIHPLVLAFIHWQPSALLDWEHSEKGIDAFCSPRALEFLSQLETAGMTKNVDAGLIDGTIGIRQGCHYAAFRRIYQELVPWEEIRVAPQKATIPEEVSAKYAVAALCGANVSGDSFEAVDTYLGRWPDKEFGVLAISLAIARSADICKCAGFTKWAIQNASLMT